MKKNRTALVLVVLLSSVTFWFVINKRTGTIKQSLRDFAVSDTASITKIFLADKAKNTVTLDKINTGEWKVNNSFIARQDAINLLLYTMKTLEVKEPVGKKAQENIVKDLASGAVKVEIYRNHEDKPFKVYFVGRETKDATGTYMLLQDALTGENSSTPFVMYIPGFEGYLTTRYFTRLTDWRSHMIMNYIAPEIKTVLIEFPEQPSKNYEVAYLGNNHFSFKMPTQVKSLPEVDTLAIKQYLGYFSNIQFEAIERGLKKTLKDSILSQPIMNKVTVTDQLDKKTIVKVFPMPCTTGQLDLKGNPLKYDQDRMYALINNDQDFVVLQYFVFGTILQEPEYFLPKKTVKK